VQRFVSYQQCTRFRTALDFDREYLWNRSSNWQSVNGDINYEFFHVRRKQFGVHWCTNENMTLTFDLWPWNSIRFVRLSRYMHMFLQNITKLSAAVHQLSCTQTFLPYLAMVKKPKIRSCDLDLWPMTLKSNSFRAAAKVHVCAKFHRAKSSGSWVRTEKKNSDVNSTVRCYCADRKYRAQCQLITSIILTASEIIA